MTTFTISFPFDELFDFCSEYTSKRIYDHKEPDANVNKELVEHYSIREDDRNLFLSFLKSGAGETFGALRSSAKSLTDAFTWDDPLTPDTVLFKCDLDDSVNPLQLEDAAKKTMCYYVLREWYIMKGFERESEIHDRNYSYNLSIVKNYGQGGGVGGGATSQTDTGATGTTTTRPHVTI